MKILHVGQMIGGLDIYIRNSIVYAESGYEYVIVHGDNSITLSKPYSAIFTFILSSSGE
jgi:hypothetical protein